MKELALTLTLNNQSSVAIWGNGLEGQAAFKHLRAKYPKIKLSYILDKAPKGAADNIILEKDLAAALGASPVDLIIKSPGVSPYKPEVQSCKALGIAFTSGTNIWLSENPKAKTIAVTGTKGKSTVTALIHYMLSALGIASKLGGNMGKPLIGTTPGKDVTVLELSSYQTAGLTYGPDLAVLTNLFEDHLDWHKDVKTYHADKLNLLRASSHTKCLLHPKALSKDDQPKGAMLTEPNKFTAGADNQILFDGAVVARNFALKGAHNLQNFILAYHATCHFLGKAMPMPAIDFSGFEQLPHRMMEVKCENGITLIDDSIATIPQAAISAIQVFGQDAHVMIGGFDRHICYNSLVTYLKKFPPKTLCLFGPVGKRLLQEFERASGTVIFAQTLSGAIAKLAPKVAAKDIVILSPAAPSYDEFKNFAQRGDFFASEFKRLLKN